MYWLSSSNCSHQSLQQFTYRRVRIPKWTAQSTLWHFRFKCTLNGLYLPSWTKSLNNKNDNNNTDNNDDDDKNNDNDEDDDTDDDGDDSGDSDDDYDDDGDDSDDDDDDFLYVYISMHDLKL